MNLFAECGGGEVSAAVVHLHAGVVPERHLQGMKAAAKGRDRSGTPLRMSAIIFFT